MPSKGAHANATHTKARRRRARRRHRIKTPPVVPLAPSLTDRIPGEIYDAIIDHLHEDNQTLAVCATVCKAWVPASRLHFFRIVSLHRGNLDGFLCLLNSPSSTLASSIQFLFIDESAQTKPQKNWFHEGIPQLVGLSAKSLQVTDMIACWTPSRSNLDKEIQCLESNFQTITDLILHGCPLHDSHQFTTFLRNLPHLRRLSLVGMPTKIMPHTHQGRRLSHHYHRDWTTWNYRV